MSGPWENYKQPEAAGPCERYRAQQSASMSPTEDMSTTERVLAGVGKPFHDVARGAGQLAGWASDLTGYQIPGAISDEEVAEARRLDEDLMKTKGGAYGNIAGHMALSSALGVPNTALKAGMLGAAYAGLQPGTSNERLFNAGLSGALGAGAQGVSNAVQKVVRPSARAHLTPTQSKTLNEAIDLGFQPTPGQVPGSRSMQLVEEGMLH